jgi:hypothetical protein
MSGKERTMGAVGAEVGSELARRLGDAATRPQEVSDFLDGLDHADRVAAVRSLGRASQRRLYELADGFRPVRLEHLVPPSVSDFAQVRHYGRNTLPVFTQFEKRFCRPRGADAVKPGELYGFNFQTMAPVTGPGYFVAREDASRPEVLVDYNFVPDEHPDGWPEIRRNERGLARFVYGFMIDTLRGVSEHVTIGSAARRGKDMGSWFVLCRES